MAWLAGVGMAACTPGLTTMMPARLVPEGHVQVSTSTDLTLPSGRLFNMAKSLRQLPAETYELTLDEAASLAQGVAALLVQPPGLGGQVSVAYGVDRNVEVGAGTTINSVRGWGRWQFLRVRPGFYGAFGLGLSSYFFGFPLGRVTDIASVRGHFRRQVEVPLQFGLSGRSGHLWFGPKWVHADYGIHVAACLNQVNTGCKRRGAMKMRGTTSYLGGQLGAALGYRRWWIMAELTVARLYARAELDVEVDEVRKVARFQENGVNVVPALGLLLWF